MRASSALTDEGSITSTVSPQPASSILHLLDHGRPHRSDFEIAGPLRDGIGDQHVVDPVDAERPLPPFGPGDEVPDVVLVDEAPRIHRPGRPLMRPAEADDRVGATVPPSPVHPCRSA